MEQSRINYPADKCIHELFEEQVKNTPKAVALVFENKELTYSELNERANQLAHYLRSKGVKNETLVPICLGRSFEMMIGVLGILKAGGAYVPIDPNYPLERIAYLLEDTKAPLVLCNKESKMQLKTFQNIDFVEVTYEASFLKHQPADNLNTGLSSNNLAYIIYTSGSTGMPKGVMIEHRSLVDHCFGVIDSANLKTCKSFALFSPLVFDAGHSIIHSCLIIGACLYVLSEDLIMDGERLASYFDDHAIDCLKIVPSLWLSYTNFNKIILAKKVMIFGGEAFALSILNNLVKSNYSGDVFNHYGPTEVTIGKCIYRVDINKTYHTVPIGKPFSNTQIYILDDNCQPIPAGSEGEIYIGGDGLARGYLNRPELTAEKFIEDPFSKEEDARLYKTGDLARWLPEGNIEYLGRIDDQVKVRGYRIELGEIESVLNQSELVSHGVVLAKDDSSGNKRLVGYVVSNKMFNKQVIRDYLGSKLPDYMVPALWVEVDSIPLTVNGKIDKKALPDPQLKDMAAEYVAPRNDTEREIAGIWQELLRVERVGVNDNFFELGGNSIQAAVLFAKIKRKFHKSFTLATIFSAPTVYQLAVAIKVTAEAQSSSSSLVPIQPNGSKTPLFCIHAGLGEVLFYGPLSLCLGEDQPFYGLQPKGIDGTELPFFQMEQMAHYYIQEIRKVQPEGPYYLAGYCLGAQIAFEMAQQLTSEGQKVALLASLNGVSSINGSPSNSIKIEKNGTSIAPLTKATNHLRRISKLPLKKKVSYISNELKRLVLRGPLLSTGNKIIGSVFKLYLFCKQKAPRTIVRIYINQSLYLLQINYKPKAYYGSMIIFRSPVIYKEPYLGWDSFVKGRIKAVNIAGLHESRRDIMNEPYVKFLAKELKNYLDNEDSLKKQKTLVSF